MVRRAETGSRDALATKNGLEPLQLMDVGLSVAARLPADVRIGGRRQDFRLPVWRDNDGDIRIGLPKFDPQHAGDIDMLVVDLGDLLTAIGGALDA